MICRIDLVYAMVRFENLRVMLIAHQTLSASIPVVAAIALSKIICLNPLGTGTLGARRCSNCLFQMADPSDHASADPCHPLKLPC